MKQFVTAIMAAAALSAGAATPLVVFNGTDHDGLSFSNSSTSSVANGHITVEMGVQSGTKTRGDMIFNLPADAEKFTYNTPDHDKIFAIKFIGDRPQKNLTMEVRNADASKTYVKQSSPHGTIKTFGGNTIVYYDLSAMGADAPFTSNRWQLKIADNETGNNTYVVDWVKVYDSVEALQADANWKDDGVNDPDEKGAISNLTSGAEFATLKEAFAAAAEGDELIINKSIELTERLSVPKNVVIKGATPEVEIKRNMDNIMMLVHNGATFENITLSSNPKSYNRAFLEIQKNWLNLKNVTIKDVKSSNNQCILAMKSGGKINADGLTFVDCESTFEGRHSYIFFGNTCALTLGGQLNNVSVFMENAASSINIGENLTVNQTIVLTLGYAMAADMAPVKGTTDTSLFALSNTTDFALVAGNNALVLAPKTVVYGGNKYLTLAEAFAAVPADAESAEISLLADAEVENTLALPAAMAINGNGNTITYTGEGPLMNADKNVAFTKAMFAGSEGGIVLTDGATATLADTISGAKFTLSHGSKVNAAALIGVDSKPVAITLAGQWAQADTVVAGSGKAEFFTLVGSEEYVLEAKDAALVLDLANPTAVNAATGIKYATLAEAVAAAQENDTINLMAAAEVEATLALPAAIAINGNGNTIAYTGEGALMTADKNVSFKDVAFEGGIVLSGSAAATLAGTVSGAELTLNPGSVVKAEALTGVDSKPVAITLEGQWAQADTVVAGSANAELFALVGSEEYVLAAKDAALVLDLANPTAVNAATGIKYATLAEAVAAAQENETINVVADAEVEATITLPAAIAINAAGNTITYTGEGALMNADKNVALTDVVFAGEEGGIVLSGSAAATLAGTISGAELTLNPGSVIKAEALAGVDSKPVVINLADSAAWAATDSTVVVLGTANTEFFTLAAMEGYSLEAGKTADGTDAIVLVAPEKEVDGIGAIFGDDNADAPAEYFDLAGRRVLSPAKGGVYIMRRAGITSKVVF